MEKQEIINHIKKSFGQYALNDIKWNKEKPIAAFILATCFIDGLSAFRYNTDEDGRFIKFMEEYLPMYKPQEFHSSFKEKLLPFYSLEGSYYKIGYGENEEGEFEGRCIIHIDSLLKNISDAFDKCMEDMEKDEFKNAIDFSQKHFVIA